MPKKQLAILCERSEQWLSGHKKKFENDKTGANVVSFLKMVKSKPLSKL